MGFAILIEPYDVEQTGLQMEGAGGAVSQLRASDVGRERSTVSSAACCSIRRGALTSIVCNVKHSGCRVQVAFFRYYFFFKLLSSCPYEINLVLCVDG